MKPNNWMCWAKEAILIKLNVVFQDYKTTHKVNTELITEGIYTNNLKYLELTIFL